MARIRTIKPDYWTDEKIVELSPWARLLFIGLWNFADDGGRMIYSPKRIKMQIFPADNLEIEGALTELVNADLITIYKPAPIPAEKGRADNVLQINNFWKHQKIDSRYPSKLPPIPASGMEWNGMEWNGMEKEGKGGGSPTDSDSGKSPEPESGKTPPPGAGDGLVGSPFVPPTAHRAPELIADAWNRVLGDVCPQVERPLPYDRLKLALERLNRWPPGAPQRLPDWWESLFRKIREIENLWRWKNGRTLHWNYLMGSDKTVAELSEFKLAPPSPADGTGSIVANKYAALDKGVARI